MQRRLVFLNTSGNYWSQSDYHAFEEEVYYIVYSDYKTQKEKINGDIKLIQPLSLEFSIPRYQLHLSDDSVSHFWLLHHWQILDLRELSKLPLLIYANRLRKTYYSSFQSSQYTFSHPIFGPHKHLIIYKCIDYRTLWKIHLYVS